MGLGMVTHRGDLSLCWDGGVVVDVMVCVSQYLVSISSHGVRAKKQTPPRPHRPIQPL